MDSILSLFKCGLASNTQLLDRVWTQVSPKLILELAYSVSSGGHYEALDGALVASMDSR